MPALTPEYLTDVESNMRVISESSYAGLSANLFWSRFCKTITSGAAKENLIWMLSTALIRDEGKGGNISFDDMVSKLASYENRFSGAGLKLRRNQLEDSDGNGVHLATQWAADIGAQAAYWPQKQMMNVLKNGHSISSTYVAAYDGKALFANDHPVDGNSSTTTYCNLHTGSDGAGACPIDTGVTADVALANLGKVVAYIRSIKMPNGEDPRGLRPVALIVPPKLQARAVQLTNAKTLAQAAASGGGGADVEAIISSFGLSVPVISDELAGFESETTWFVACEQVGATQLGSLVYVEREPFRVTYYTGQGGGTGADAKLDRMNELEWHGTQRSVMAPGHPYMIHKVKAT